MADRRQSSGWSRSSLHGLPQGLLAFLVFSGYVLLQYTQVALIEERVCENVLGSSWPGPGEANATANQTCPPASLCNSTDVEARVTAYIELCQLSVGVTTPFVVGVAGITSDTYGPPPQRRRRACARAWASLPGVFLQCTP